MVQGASFGFLMRSLSVILNKNLSTTEVGIISFCSFPYNVKFLLSPLVETKYFKFLGKRRSWIVPTLILSGLTMLYLSQNIYYYIENRCVYTLLFTFMLIFVCNATQDISVDGWSVTMVKEENLSHAATSQMIGLRLGGFLSTSVYYALSSTEFCNQFIYFSEKAEPILNEELYFKIWGFLVILIALYVLCFADERNDRIQIDEEENEINSIYDNIKIGMQLFKNPQIQICILFFIMENLLCSFNSFVGTMILLNDLKYSQDKFSIVSFFNFPMSIAASILLSRYIKSNAFMTMYWLIIFKAIYDIIFVNGLLYFYFEGIAFDTLLFISQATDQLFLSGIFACKLAYANIICDPKVASTHITLICSIANMCVMIPRIYTYWLVQNFKIFMPNFIGCSLTILIFLALHSLFSNPIMKNRLKAEKSDIKGE